MGQDSNRSIFQPLTKPSGVLVAAPVILGLALAVTLTTASEPTIARDSLAETHQPTAKAATKVPAAALENRAQPKVVQRPLRLAASDTPAGKNSFSDMQREEIGRIVREYLLANPEVLVEVSTELERRRKAEQADNQKKVLASEKSSIFRSPHDFVLGNPKGDVTIVEYFDYNCGWCKRALNEVRQLTKDDKNVRIVMKEFPIFGENSAFAAKAALASITQDKYWEFHMALMKAQRVTTDNTMKIAESVGIDVAALKAEMAKPKYDEIIAENSRIAQALGMQGTPGFIIDSQINYGYLPQDRLKATVADIRKNGCKIC